MSSIRKPAPGRENKLVDIDGTVCEDIPNEERERFPTAKVLPGAVEKVNGYYDAGDTITFFTSRQAADRDATLDWLMRHGFKFDGLITDKPRGGNYNWIDNLPGRYTTFGGDWSKT